MRKLETMRSFRLALIGLFIVAGAVGCAEADPWVGEWREVAVEASGHDLFRTMVLERDKNGALVGSIESESRILSDGRPVAQFLFRFDEVTELDSKLRLRLRYVDESKDRITITLSPMRKKRLLEGRQTLGGLNRERPIRFRWNAPGRLEKQTRTFQRCGGTTLLGATSLIPDFPSAEIEFTGPDGTAHKRALINLSVSGGSFQLLERIRARVRFNRRAASARSSSSPFRIIESIR